MEWLFIYKGVHAKFLIKISVPIKMSIDIIVDPLKINI